ncbi:unnamed protein product, partial [Owenia fusiformis]
NKLNMPHNKTIQNIFLILCSVLLIVTIRNQNKNAVRKTMPRDVDKGNQSGLENTTADNDYNDGLFEATTKDGGFINKDMIDHTLTKNKSRKQILTTTTSDDIINPENNTKLDETEQQIYDEFGFVHKITDFFRYEKKMNEDCTTGRVKRAPNTVIVGIQRCGARMLRSLLGAHPSIAAAAGEPHFFDLNYSEPLTWYLRKMPCSSKEQVTIESTPSYFNLADPARIYAFNPNMKLILAVCDPVKRTLSDFIYNQRLGHIPKSRNFEDMIIGSDGDLKSDINIVQHSNYLYPLIKYKRHFQLNQIYPVDLDSLKIEPWKQLNKIEDYLGVEHVFRQSSFWFNADRNVYCLSPSAFNVANLKSLDVERNGCIKTSKRPSKPIMEDLRQKLEKHFTVYISGFCGILGSHTCRNYKWTPIKRTSVRAPN